MKWHTMDEEPLMCGVILYDGHNNRIYDATYLGEGFFQIERLTLPKGHFTHWIQRGDFFQESGLAKAKKGE